MKYLKKLLTSFCKKEEGVVAIIVALALVGLLFGVLSLTIDLNRTQASHQENYNATDAAALAGAEMWLHAKVNSIGKIDDPLKFRPSAADMEDYVKNVLISNFSQDQSSAVFLDDGSFIVSMDERRKGLDKTVFSVKVQACATLDAPVARAAEHAQQNTTQRTCTTSTAAFELGKLENTEVAFALDFTESMYWKGTTQACPPGNSNPTGCPTYTATKAYALQQAMSYVLDTYFRNTVDATAFASIVPYTGFVNVYPFADNGVVQQTATRIDYDGKTFRSSDYNNPNNAHSQYRPFGITVTTGNDLNSYVYDPDFKQGTAASGNFTPFYTYEPYDGDDVYETQNYSDILGRIPVISSENELNQIISASNKTSFLPFKNYHSLVNTIANQNFVYDPSKSVITNWGTTDPNEQYAKMICYQYTIAAAADERVDNALESSAWTKSYTGRNGDKDIELHESFPIQPLTSDVRVLKNVVDRYVAQTRLATGNVYNDSHVVDLQSRRLDKVRIISTHHKTSSIHGLIWAWFTLRPEWQPIWEAEDSLHEIYVGGNKSSRDGSSGGDKLPSEKNFKHIILISDGVDNDGCNDRSGGATGSDLGRKNVCDAYTPIEPITDNQYDRLCTAIKTNSTTDTKDDITIHTIMLDFDPATAGSNPSCLKTENRFEKCASKDSYYNNITPAQLRNVFDQIFASILSNAVPVRLTE